MAERWPLRVAPFWAAAPFFHLLLPLIAAIVCYDSGWLRPSPYWVPAAALLLALLLVIAFLKRQYPATKAIFLPALYALVFCFAALRAQQADIRAQPCWFAKSNDTGTLNLVRITSPPAEKERIVRMQVSILKSAGSKCETVCGNAFLNVYKTDTPFAYKERDELLVPARWQEVSNSGNPFEVDYKTLNRRRNIYHQQFLAAGDVQLYKAGAHPQESILQKAHSFCNAQLVRFVKDSAAYGLLQAMLLGDESSFDPALRQAYSETGVIHIVSISGSHVGVLFAAIALLLSGIKGRKGSWLRFVAGLAVIWFYVLMAGAPPSALRAAIMFSVIAFGTAFAREAQPLNTLFAAAVALLLANPAWLFAVGFQLSFGAVLSLILFYEPLYKISHTLIYEPFFTRWAPVNRVLQSVCRALAASFAAELLTAPLVVYYFHNFPLFFAVANLLAAALLGLLALLGGMLIILLSFLPPLAAAVAWGVTGLVKIFNAIIIVLQGWNPASFKYLQISRPELWLLYGVMAGFALFFIRKNKAGLWLGMSLTVALFVLLCADRLTIMQQERVVVYNISRHNAIECICGNRYQVLHTDTSRAEAFVTKLAHTGWGAWRTGGAQPAECFLLKGKRIVLLNAAPAAGAAPFPADILIVQCPLRDVKPDELKRIFNPQIVVAGGAQKRWQVEQWVQRSAAGQVPFHAVSKDGAYVFE